MVKKALFDFVGSSRIVVSREKYFHPETLLVPKRTGLSLSVVSASFVKEREIALEINICLLR